MYKTSRENNRTGFVQKCEIDYSNVRGVQAEAGKRKIVNREK